MENKYQYALDYTCIGCQNCNFDLNCTRSLGRCETYNTLQELVDKSTPKKYVARHIKDFDGYDDGECPTCGASLDMSLSEKFEYCPYCGQKIYWGEDE